MAGLARRQQHEAVVRRRIAVDRDAVERQVGGFTHQGLQQRRRDVGIGGDETQHRGHVGPDHPRTLADPRDGDRLPIDLHLARSCLGHGIGRHDGLGRDAPVAFLQVSQRRRQSGFDAIGGQRLHDHAGRERQHLLRCDLQLARQGHAGRERADQPVFAGARVRIAGVDDQRTRAHARCEVLARQLHRRGAEAVLREHTRHGAALLQRDDREIASVGLAYAGHGDAQLHAGNRVQCVGVGSQEIDGHGASMRSVKAKPAL